MAQMKIFTAQMIDAVEFAFGLCGGVGRFSGPAQLFLLNQENESSTNKNFCSTNE